MLNKLIQDLNKLKSKEKAKILAGFFKTGKGEYGEGDVFLGITVPEQRKVAKKYLDLKLTDIQKLLNSKIHEHRLVALMILVEQYEKDIRDKKLIVDFYLKNTKKINNWDLVDSSAHYILGDYLFDKEKDILYNLLKSDNLWERRIAVISTFSFLRQGRYAETLEFSEKLLNDREDLIHKACGWMLRELGKRDIKVLRKFLDKFTGKMPRTMLRYSIEKFSKPEREKYLKKK